MARHLLLTSIVGLFAFVVYTLKSAGHFKCIRPTPTPHCALVAKHVRGAEDIQHLEKRIFLGASDDRSLWLSAGDPREAIASVPAHATRGSIVVFDFDSDDAQGGGSGAGGAEGESLEPKTWDLVLKNYTPIDFHPHGLSMYRDAGGAVSVFVVNHRRDGDFVEIFTLERSDGAADGGAAGLPVALVHRESVPGWELNDVVAWGPRSFYVTSWNYFAKNTLLNKVEAYLQLRLTALTRCAPRAAADGEAAKDGPIECGPATRQRFAMANGVALSPDGTRLYLAASIGQSLHVFRIPEDRTAQLIPEETVLLSMAVDNLDVHPATGDIYAAGHPQLLAFAAHSHAPWSVHAPSEVLRISRAEETSSSSSSSSSTRRRKSKKKRLFKRKFRTRESGSYKVETLLMLDGLNPSWSAASVAAFGGESDLVVGPVFSDGVIHCRLAEAPRQKTDGGSDDDDARCPAWKRGMNQLLSFDFFMQKKQETVD